MLTLREHLISLLFCKGVREIQVFVFIVVVSSFSLCQFCHVWTMHSWWVFYNRLKRLLHVFVAIFLFYSFYFSLLRILSAVLSLKHKTRLNLLPIKTGVEIAPHTKRNLENEGLFSYCPKRTRIHPFSKTLTFLFKTRLITFE